MFDIFRIHGNPLCFGWQGKDSWARWESKEQHYFHEWQDLATLVDTRCASTHVQAVGEGDQLSVLESFWSLSFMQCVRHADSTSDTS